VSARAAEPDRRLRAAGPALLDGYFSGLAAAREPKAIVVATDGAAPRGVEVSHPAEHLGLGRGVPAAPGGRTFVRAPVDWWVGPGWFAARNLLSGGDGPFTAVGVHRGLCDPAAFGDLGVLRSLPEVSIVVPADAAQTRAAVATLESHAGAAYLRLTSEERAPVSDGTFALARAMEVSSGADLAIAAVGAAVGLAVDVARELAKVGVGARVLNFASLKPFDQKSLARASRETGAILTLEEHAAGTGLGSLVASAVVESYPVPVRSLAALDVRLDPGATPEEARAAHGLTRERALEEAWALLRAKGTVT
jgi:transketolase C-terminal domain/subunit